MGKKQILNHKIIASEVKTCLGRLNNRMENAEERCKFEKRLRQKLSKLRPRKNPD